MESFGFNWGEGGFRGRGSSSTTARAGGSGFGSVKGAGFGLGFGSIGGPVRFGPGAKEGAQIVSGFLGWGRSPWLWRRVPRFRGRGRHGCG
ncbi:hypothetical protein TIFTF001_008986 [Ficus carica]|uniref:Uncharacterized protein n=1 Tax=Ficus carica TaxID=3494 RepID=A0AA87ZT64_FICCA|nr:hypothetical protein TIFTF001_008986 [Ficus carica]